MGLLGVAEMFKVCGDIVLVRILRPGNPIPADVRPFVNKHPEMAGKVCALVEFEKTEFAMKAVREKNCEEEEKMKVKGLELVVEQMKMVSADVELSFHLMFALPSHAHNSS